jgi:hypothetical protein
MKNICTTAFRAICIQLLVISIFLLNPFTIFGKEYNQKEAYGNPPAIQGQNNAGQDFWFSIPPGYELSTDNDHWVKIFVTSNVKTKVTMDIPAKGYTASQMTIPNDIIIFSPPPVIAQPFTKIAKDEPKSEQIYQGCGIHVWAEQPFICYAIMMFNSFSEGFLCLPTGALGKEYIVASYNSDAMFKAVWDIYAPSEVCIVAAYDKTKVKFTLGGNQLTKTAGGLTNGQSAEVNMQSGDVWVFQSNGDGADLTGSTVIANKPIAVISGNVAANMPVGNQWSNYSCEMQTPTTTWGTNYHIPASYQRKYPGLIRVFAKDSNTKVFRDGKQISFVPDPGGVEGRGFQDMRMGQMGKPLTSHVLSGDKPIGVTFYNTGLQEDGYPLPADKPNSMTIIPDEQFLTDITFFIPKTDTFSIIRDKKVEIVYQTDSVGLIPDDLMIAEFKNGVYDWQKMSEKFPGVGEIFAYNVDKKAFGMKVLSLPSGGMYKMKASTPFMAYLIAYESSVGAAFPLGCSLNDLFAPSDTIPPNPPWTMCCCGNVPETTVTDMPDDDNIRSNLTKIILNKDSSYNYDLVFDTFEPGVDRSTKWHLNTIDPYSDARAVILFSDRRGNDTILDIRYYAKIVQVDTNNYSFGKMSVGEEKTHDFTLKNISNAKPAMITDIKFLHNNQHFEFIGLPAIPFMLGSSGEIPFSVKFTAIEAGTFQDSIIVKVDSNYQSRCDLFRSYVEAIVDSKIDDVDDEISGNNIDLKVIPNPAEENCTIFYNIPGNQKVKIYIMNSLGEIVRTLTDGFILSNQGEIRLDAKELPIGIYNIILDYGFLRKSIKLTILR